MVIPHDTKDFNRRRSLAEAFALILNGRAEQARAALADVAEAGAGAGAGAEAGADTSSLETLLLPETRPAAIARAAAATGCASVVAGFFVNKWYAAASSGDGVAAGEWWDATLLLNDRQAAIDLAAVAAYQGALHEAADLLRDVCAREPDSAAWATLGGVSFRLGRIQEALDAFMEAARTDSGAALSVSIAYAHAALGNRDQAVAVLSGMEDRADVTVAEVWGAFVILLSVGERQKALEVQELARRWRGDRSAEALEACGLMLKTKAAEDLEPHAERLGAVREATCMVVAGLMHERLGQRHAAVEAYREVLALLSSATNAMVFLSQISDDPDEAHRHAREANEQFAGYVPVLQRWREAMLTPPG